MPRWKFYQLMPDKAQISSKGRESSMNFVKATVFPDHGINRFEASCPTMACAFCYCSVPTQFNQDLSANANDEKLEVSNMPAREKCSPPVSYP